VDTRTKIVPYSDAARIAVDGATVVSGYFDPLLVSHADRLERLKRAGAPLLVLISDPERAILPARARAELVAGLKVVDYVAEGGEGIPIHHRLEEEDRRRLEELIAHVQARQSGG
jgi:bifunctional ADP-heptose synthase (sugar kinase/adenylyltransferase)